MSLITDYATTDELKAHLSGQAGFDETWAQTVITAASRAIDMACDRRFGQAPSPTPRVFTWRGEYIDGQPALIVDDISTATGLTFDGYTIGTDTFLWPYSALDDGEPATHIILAPAATGASTGCYDHTYRALTVTAQWGWAAVPSLVEVACLIQAARWYMRRYSWSGVAGSPDLGNELRLLEKLDNDVLIALAPVTRYWGSV